MQTRYAIGPNEAALLGTAQLREEFLETKLMVEGEINFVYTHYDRFIFGGAVPTSSAVKLESYDALKADYFLQRRELGIINVGQGSGTVSVEGEDYELAPLECLYVGMGAKEVAFTSADASNPAKFYLNSAPAHHSYPTTKATQAEANRVDLGADETANKRIIFQYIHEEGIKSCQLVMGYTELLPGSIWNTFPPHTHDRRMEVYYYFDLPEDQAVLHLMGQPEETRHLVMMNEDAVISPPWSIHSGAGTSAYKFVWGMAGENMSFGDMDGVKLSDLK